MIEAAVLLRAGSVGAVFSPGFSRTRLIAALALLAVALGALASSPRLGAAPGLFAIGGHGERWLANADDIQPAKLETAKGAAIEKRPAPTGPLKLAALREAPALRPVPSRAVLASFDAAPAASAAHHRPDPTGPPLLG